MAHDAAGPREEGEGLSAQLRYDALVHLVAKWNRATDLDHAARAFAAGLKFVLSLGPFRLAVREGNAFVVVQGTSGELQVLRADGALLSTLEGELFERGTPRLLEGPALAREGLPPVFAAVSLEQVYGAATLGPSGRPEHTLLIASEGSRFSALDLKFARLAADLFADKVRQLRAEASLREAHGHLSIQARHLDERNRAMRLVLDHVDQGLALIDTHGRLAAECSRPFERWFGRVLPGGTLPAHLAPFAPTFAAMLDLGLAALRDAFLPEQVVLAQFPSRLDLPDKVLRAAYTPMRQGERLERLLVVLSDAAKELACEALAEDQRELMALFQQVSKDNDGFRAFFEEASGLVARLEHGAMALQEERRALHTLKGSAGLCQLDRIVALCHRLEDAMTEEGRVLSRDERRTLSIAWSHVAERVRLLSGARASGGVELTEAQAASLAGALRGSGAEGAARSLEELFPDRVTPRLARLAEHARALASRRGVSLAVQVRGPARDTASLRGARQEVPSLLWLEAVHLVRNAVEHGLASATPELTLEAWFAGATFSLRVEDNGAGIDWNAVRARAAERGLPAGTPAELTQALLAPGFTTRDRATDLSGRGEGLASVDAAVRSLGGGLALESAPGGGTRVTLTVPLGREDGSAQGSTQAPAQGSVQAPDSL